MSSAADGAASAPAARSIAIVLTTVGHDSNADEIARTLVGEQLAACVSVLPAMTSTYRWQSAIEQQSEQQLIIKTTAERVAAVQQRLQQLHAYELPEFLVLTAGAAANYAAWVAGSVAAAG